MAKLKCWKKQKVEPNRILWTKGKFKAGEGYKDWIHLDDERYFSTYRNGDDNFEVGARKKINPKTINGHFKHFKNKSSAIKLVNKYLKEQDKC